MHPSASRLEVRRAVGAMEHGERPRRGGDLPHGHPPPRGDRNHAADRHLELGGRSRFGRGRGRRPLGPARATEDASVSWAAHEFESYVIQRHVRVRLSYLAVLLGCLLPDLFTKLPVYGLHLGSLELARARVPAQCHRGWPGVGCTHSLALGVLGALLILAVTKSRRWAIGILLGQWSHVLTDAFDSVGTMIFFPFTTQHYALG